MSHRGSRATPPVVHIGGRTEPQPLEDRADNRVLIPPMTTAPQRPPSDLVWSLDGQTMGTTWAVRLVPPPGADRQALEAVIQQELDAVIALFSPWERNSEISRFNVSAAGTWALSEPFWDFLNEVMDLADDTNGAVDPTLGALVDLWGFGPPGPRPVDDFHNPILPSDEDVATALLVSGWRKLRLNREARAAVQPGGMKLDFSGVAKGHAVDRLSRRLALFGATSHLIEIGGELKGVGVKPDGQPWWVEIEQAPDAPGPRTVAALVDLAVATSGDYRRAFVRGDRLYPHTIDGESGRPVDNGVASVTVLDPSALRADAFATALTVMGGEDGPDFARAMGLAAHFVIRTSRGLTEKTTPAFNAMLDEAD